jgi:hypothetical protein
MNPCRDPRVDAYIEAAAPFARPILARLRELMHTACPELVETIKWGMPFFLVEGRMLGHMAAFKQHAAFGFVREARSGVATGREDEAMGQFGRLCTLEDLPDAAELLRLIGAAAEQVRETSVAARPARPARRGRSAQASH